VLVLDGEGEGVLLASTVVPGETVIVSRLQRDASGRFFVGWVRLSVLAKFMLSKNKIEGFLSWWSQRCPMLTIPPLIAGGAGIPVWMV